MRLPYQFNEKDDPEFLRWGMNAENVSSAFVETIKLNNGSFAPREIEQRISILAGALGNFAELLISKGIIGPQDFLNALDAQYVYEVRENNQF